MANVIRLKRSSVAGKIPEANDLSVGEIAVNTADGILYTKHSDNTVRAIGNTQAIISNISLNSVTTTGNYTYQPIEIRDTTVSTSVTTGALTVAGGLGVQGNVTAGKIYSDNIFFANGQPYISATSNNTNIYNGKTTASSSPTVLDTLTVADLRSVKWLLSVKDNVNNTYKTSTIDSITNGSAVYYNEYGVVTSGTAEVAAFTVSIASGNLNLYGTGDSNNVSVTFQRVTLDNTTEAGQLPGVGVGGGGGTGYTGSQGIQGPAGYTGSAANGVIGYLGSAGGGAIAGNLFVNGTVTVTNSILPTTSNVIDIGSPTQRFGAIYLAGNTIDLGGTQITTDAAGELVFTTAAGNVSLNANTINFLSSVANTSQTVGDLKITGNVTASAYFYANGQPLTGGTGAGGSGASAIVSPTFKGALLTQSAAKTLPADTTTVIDTFGTVVYDTTNGQLTSAASAFTIPAGVTRVKLSGSIFDAASISDQLSLKFIKNGLDIYSSQFDNDTAGGDWTVGFTPVIPVAQGDVFQAAATAGLTRSIDVGNFSWIAIEIVEGSILNQSINIVGYTGSAGVGFTGSAGTQGAVGYTGSAGTSGSSLVLDNIQNASGTVVDFNIPTWAKRITLMYHGISIGASTSLIVQIGTSAGFETSGYFSVYEGINTSGTTSSVSTATTGYGLFLATGGADIAYGMAILTHMGNNIWTITGTLARDSTTDAVYMTSGSKQLSGTLNQIRLTTISGSAFDAGVVNVLYE